MTAQQLKQNMLKVLDKQIANRQALRPDMELERGFSLAFENDETLQKVRRFISSFSTRE